MAISSLAQGPDETPGPDTLEEELIFQAHVRNNEVDLIWTTSYERNSDRFEIERSIDGESFEYMGTVFAAGSSEDVLQYYYTDEEPFTGHNHYRVRMVDLDGADRYTGVQKTYIHREKRSELKLIPNPTGPGSMLSIQASGLASNAHQLIEVRTNRGEVVIIEHATTDQNGDLSARMSVTMQQGLYIVSVVGDGEGISAQLIVM